MEEKQEDKNFLTQLITQIQDSLLPVQIDDKQAAELNILAHRQSSDTDYDIITPQTHTPPVEVEAGDWSATAPQAAINIAQKQTWTAYISSFFWGKS